MLIPVFLVFYFGLLLLWAWPMERFAAPVLPLILYLFWRAFGKVRGAAWFRWPLLAGTLIAIVYLGWARYADCRVVMANGAYTTYNWKAVRSMAAWIERFTPPDAILAATLDPTLYLCTGRRGLRAFNLDPVALYYRGSDQAIRADEMLGEIRQSHATYLARTSPPSGGRDVLALNRAIEDMLRMRPRAFHLVYQGAPGYAVYRIDAPALD
jgi:hypothetical protein